MAHGSHQLAFPARPTWGGRRAGAGRKPAPGRRPGVAHATDHLHLIVEADDRATLARGVRGLAIRVARAVNRALDRRGAVCADRYHARALTSPRAVRHALIYVLMNRRKHCAGERGLDPCSSAPWFTGWRNALATLPGPPPVVGARTWLAAVGWRRHGLIDGATECPRTKRLCRKAHHGHLDRYLPRQEDRSAGR